MILRILNILIALMTIVVSANGQTLSVKPIEVQTGEQTELSVSLSEATTMTALQFNLQLPEGVTVDANSATLGAATDGHTLSVQTLDGGDLLFILYSMDLNFFKDGELLHIPVTAGNSAVNTTGKLYTVRTASISGEDAVSHPCSDAQFNVRVQLPIAIQSIQTSYDGSQDYYDLSGRKVEKPVKGIYIRSSTQSGASSIKNSRKVLMK